MKKRVKKVYGVGSGMICKSSVSLPPLIMLVGPRITMDEQVWLPTGRERPMGVLHYQGPKTKGWEGEEEGPTKEGRR